MHLPGAGLFATASIPAGTAGSALTWQAQRGSLVTEQCQHKLVASKDLSQQLMHLQIAGLFLAAAAVLARAVGTILCWRTPGLHLLTGYVVPAKIKGYTCISNYYKSTLR